ncbi:sugar-binding domain-containing protein [Quadrisphaera sp. INWT6]|uniref:sugar-binding domain-containing protein n=1 Tax=Quadrisphaera sp. INWT6 TaxID=2596917 RepID=UPI0018921888|nr:sugar-binding domain-containing protein [Quadrisphaera sp. INWT6]
MAQTRGGARAAGLGTGGLALAVEAARRFHLEGASKVQIAADLGVSRFKVARLLEAARAAGVVQIRIGAPPQLDGALGDALRERYGLRQALVLTGEHDADDDTEAGPLGGAVGRLAADYAQQLVSPDDVVGLAWGHAMSAVSAGWTEHTPARFVQLAGTIGRPDVRLDAPGLVRTAAAAAGGTPAYYYAPLLMPDAASAAALRDQAGVREALAELDELTLAVVSIGAWAPGESTVFDNLGQADREVAAGAGVVAETTGLLLDAGGRVVDVLADRVLAVSAEQLRRTPRVVALGVGAGRAGAVAAVARSGLVDTLVTHSGLARALLEV